MLLSPEDEARALSWRWIHSRAWWIFPVTSVLVVDVCQELERRHYLPGTLANAGYQLLVCPPPAGPAGVGDPGVLGSVLAVAFCRKTRLPARVLAQQLIDAGAYPGRPGPRTVRTLTRELERGQDILFLQGGRAAEARAVTLTQAARWVAWLHQGAGEPVAA